VRKMIPRQHFNHIWTVDSHAVSRRHQGNIGMAINYSTTKVTLFFPQGDEHKFSLSKVYPGRTDW